MSSPNYSLSNNKNPFSFQEKAAQQALDAVMQTGKAVVAIACGGGKTTVSQWIIKKYIQLNGSDAKILVITENSNALKNQYLAEIENAHIPIAFTCGEFASKDPVQVRVGIAASLHKVPWREIDLIICDESHRHFKKRRVQAFLQSIKISHQILLTGTPAQFIKEDESTSRMKVIGISGSFLQEKGLYAGVDLDVVKVVDKNDPKQSLDAFFAHALRVGADLSKTLLVCPTIAFARSVAQELNEKGSTVFLSTSENDKDNQILISSKAWEKKKESDRCFLVTVGKCSLGYNDSAISCLADMRSSLGSLCTNQQIFARILRDSKPSKRKFYFRISNRDAKSYNRQVLMLHKLKSYMSSEIFLRYNGRNLKMELCRG